MQFLEDYNIFDREQSCWFLQINLESGLSHIGESVGNQSNLKTMDLIGLDNKQTRAFVFSGNAFRNRIIRRVGIGYVCDRLGIKLTPDTHHTFFAGGRIDSSTASDIGLDNNIRQMLPWISVLGTAKPKGVLGSNASQMIPGRINVGNGLLICLENIEYIYRQLPGLLPLEALESVEKIVVAKSKLSSDPFVRNSVRDTEEFQKVYDEEITTVRNLIKSWTNYVTENQITRKDSLEDPEIAKFVVDSQLKIREGSDKMIASSRLIKAGSQLVSRWDSKLTDIEIGFVLRSLVEFSKSPYLGGMGSRGCGLISFVLWDQNPTAEIIKSTVNQKIQISAYGQEKLAAFEEFLANLKALMEEHEDFAQNKYLKLFDSHLLLAGV